MIVAAGLILGATLLACLGPTALCRIATGAGDPGTVITC